MKANVLKLKKIVREHQAMEIDGVLIDAFSASAALEVYNTLSERNKEHFASQPLPVMIDQAFTLLERLERK